MNAIQTDRTYKTADNAKTALVKALSHADMTLDDVRWLVGVSEDGRFAPVLIGARDRQGRSQVHFAFIGITVVG